MANTVALRKGGPTAALSVVATSHAAVTVSAASTDSANFAAFLNTGAATVAVNVAPTNAAAAVLPVDGTPSDVILLPPSMTQPIVYAVPPGSFSVTAIGSAAGPSLVYITPLVVL